MRSDTVTNSQVEIAYLYGAFESDDRGRWTSYYSAVGDQAVIPYQTVYESAEEDQFPLQPYTEDSSPKTSTALVKIEPVKPFSQNFIFWAPAGREIPASFFVNFDAEKLRLTLGEPSLFLFRLEILRPPANDWVFPDARQFGLTIDLDDAVEQVKTTIATVVATRVNAVWFAALTGSVKQVIPPGSKLRLTVGFPGTTGSGHVQVFVQMITLLVNYQHRMHYRPVDTSGADSPEPIGATLVQRDDSMENESGSVGSWDDVEGGNLSE